MFNRLNVLFSNVFAVVYNLSSDPKDKVALDNEERTTSMQSFELSLANQDDLSQTTSKKHESNQTNSIAVVVASAIATAATTASVSASASSASLFESQRSGTEMTPSTLASKRHSFFHQQQPPQHHQQQHQQHQQLTKPSKPTLTPRVSTLMHQHRTDVASSASVKSLVQRPHSQEAIIEECQHSLDELIKASKWSTNQQQQLPPQPPKWAEKSSQAIPSSSDANASFASSFLFNNHTHGGNNNNTSSFKTTTNSRRLSKSSSSEQVSSLAAAINSSAASNNSQQQQFGTMPAPTKFCPIQEVSHFTFFHTV